MLTVKPFKALVCLEILILMVLVPLVGAYSGSDVLGVPSIPGETLSADQKNRTKPKLPDYSSGTSGSSKSYSSGTKSTHSSSSFGHSSRALMTPMPAPAPIAQPAVATCGPQPIPCAPVFDDPCIPYLPRPGCKKFVLNAKLWHANLYSSKVIWGTNLAGGPGTELSLTGNLGLSKYDYVAEYESICQIRPNWGIRFSFMPIEWRDNYTPSNFFFFGNAVFPAGFSTLTQWNRYIYSWDLTYDWYQAKHAISSIFAGYSLYDDKLSVSNSFQRRSRSNGFGLAYAGLGIQRVITTVGQATVSTNCKWSAQFLEGYFGWDGYAAGRIAVPFQFGRYGYVEAGWKWVVLERTYPTNADNTNLQGAIGAVGLIF